MHWVDAPSQSRPTVTRSPSLSPPRLIDQLPDSTDTEVQQVQRLVELQRRHTQVDGELQQEASRVRAQLEYLDTLHRTLARQQIPLQPFVGGTKVEQGGAAAGGANPS